MKVLYKTVLAGDRDKRDPTRAWHYELLAKYGKIENVCCQEMQGALDDGAITFGDDATPALCFSRCYPYPEGACYDYFSIKFCSFCGKAIEYREAKRTKYREVSKNMPATIVTNIVEEEA